MGDTLDQRDPAAMGVHLEGITLDTALAGSLDRSGTCEVRCMRGDVGSSLPPAALLPRLLGEPLRVDRSLPGHVRGAGLEWPPEAWVDRDHGAGRFPAAYAWPMLCSPGNAQWPWEPEGDCNSRRVCSPAEALGAAASDELREHRIRDGGPSPVVVIPNDLAESAQDDLIDCIESRGWDVRLLWRPVAAVLQWIEQHRQRLEAAWSERTKTVGKVVALHLGADGFECDVLDVVRDKTSDSERFVPARRRPVYPPAPWMGVEIIETLGHLCLSRAGQADLPSLWRVAWASPWPHWARALVTGGVSEDTAIGFARRLGFESSLIQDVCPCWNQMASSLDALASILLADRPESLREFRSSRGLPRAESDLRSWLSEVRKKLRESAGAVIGCVATGTFASFPLQATKLARAVLERVLGHVPPLTIVEGSTADGSPTACGAALYAARLHAGITGYYDTLPPLQVLTLKMGNPRWSKLLKEDDQFVEGGKPFKPPDREGYYIRANDSKVVLQVVLGEHPTVRKVESRLPRRAKANQPIRLRVSITPARGNAKVRIIPHDPAFLEGHPPIFLDWKTSQDTKQSPEEVLSGLPRICPELEPRIGSLDLWRKMVGDFESCGRTLKTSKSPREIYAILDDAKRQLQKRDQRIRRDKGAYKTAVSSDGKVQTRPEVLEEFFDAVAGLLRHSGCDKGLVLRVLAYGSSDHESLRRYLVKNIGSTTLTANHNAGVFACGECLRDPDDIARFADRLIENFRGGLRKGQYGLEWFRAFAKILMYRELACESLTTDKCLELTERFLGAFQGELRKGNCNYVFRYSALCIVFLLRRRIFDDAYLMPDSGLAERVKEAFRDAKRQAQQRRVLLMGGAVNLPETLDRLIDYIDQRGHGTISEGLFDAGGEEDEES